MRPAHALAPAVLVLLLTVPLPVSPSLAAERPKSAEADLEAAETLFQRNLDAIRRRDREDYLGCYLQSEDFVRVSPSGQVHGYEAHAALSTEDSWPDVFEALNLELVPVRPGVVFGTYRYRIRYGPNELQGLSERIFVETGDGWKIAMTSAFQEPEGTPPVPRAFTLATLIDGTGRPPIPGAVVVMRSGRIECAGAREECPVPDDAVVTPLPGHWITPGLVDAHVHFSQTGYADGRPDFVDIRKHIPYEGVIAKLRTSPERFLQSYICSGVTAVFDVGGYPWTLELPGRAERDTLSPHVAAAGPLLAPRDHSILNLPGDRQILHMTDIETARRQVDYLQAMGSQAVKIWWVNSPGATHEETQAMVSAAAERARELGLPVIAHATSLERAKGAIRAGAHLLVHSVEDQEVDEEFLSLASESEVIYCPTLTVREGYSRLREAVLESRALQAEDPLACVDPATRANMLRTASLNSDYLPERLRGDDLPDRRPVMEANLRKVRDAGIAVAMGTDAGNPLTLHGASVQDEMLAMEEAGLTPMEVITAATRDAARAMGRAGDLGTVERGKHADLLVLGADPTETVRNFRHLLLVVRGGIVRHQAELRAPLR